MVDAEWHDHAPSLELDGVPLVVAQAVAQSKGLLGQAHEQRQLQDPFFCKEKHWWLGK